jgi:hypothetical protein
MHLSIFSLLSRFLRRCCSRHPSCDGFTKENWNRLQQREGNGPEGILRCYGCVQHNIITSMSLTVLAGLKDVVDLDARAGGTAFAVV